MESQFENLHLNHDSSNSPEAYRGLLPAIFHPTSEETHTKCTITSTPSFAESSKFPLKSSLSPPTITRSEKDQIGAASQPALSLFSPTSDQRRYFRGFQGPSKSLSLESSKYKCPVGDCPKAYRQSTFLKRHMAIRHGVRHHNSFKESESRVFSKSEPEQKTQTYRCLFAFCRKEYRLLSNLGTSLSNESYLILGGY